MCPKQWCQQGGQLGHFAPGPQALGGPQAVEEAPKLDRYRLPTFNCQLFTISNHIYNYLLVEAIQNNIIHTAVAIAL